MLKILLARAQQRHRTMRYPAGPPPAMPEHFRGAPTIDASNCPDGCRKCAEACPTDAITFDGGKPAIDLGRCIFCPECETACPEKAITYSDDYRLSVRSRDDLKLGSGEELRLAAALDGKMKSLFGRSLKLRVVSAGDCNGCASDVNVLGTIGWDLGRFGIQYVASPRHADGLVVLGPVTENMRLALKKTYDAVPEPKIVIAIGACAISGGIYAGSPEQHGGAESVVPVDLFIAGCPPHPLTILDGLLRLLGRIETGR
ncbi:MAG: 4Fe-4S dicluster domain-containing protein [Thermoanaerobaculia bacterium]|jgi:Ni,Fe-hydrogenase III small subunit/NAD-dependent dihydropyrimidine dehydrogenase PreA subunit